MTGGVEQENQQNFTDPLRQANLDSLYNLPEVNIFLQFPVSRYLAQLKADMFEEDSRYYIYTFVSFWKMALFLVLFLVMSFGFDRVSDVRVLFNDFSPSFGVSAYSLEYENGTLATEELGEVYGFPQKVIITQVRLNDPFS